MFKLSPVYNGSWFNAKFSLCFTSKYKVISWENLAINHKSCQEFFRHYFNRKISETKIKNKTLTLPKQALPSSVIASALYNAFTSSSSIVLTPGLLVVKTFKRNSHHKIMCKVTVIFSNLRRLSKNRPSAKDCCPSCHQTATE